MRKIGVGVVVGGVISKAYMTAMQRFSTIELKAVSDMRSAPAEARGAEFGVSAMRVDQMLKRDDIEIVVNLTPPLAHTDASLAVLNVGKHVHSEKPLGVNMVEARKVIDLAAAKNLRVGCAPDTFLGGGHQTARKLIDDGVIGTPVAGTAVFGCPGHERWHPAPGFYYLRGGGPMLDMGPYYITDLIQLLGPIASVMGVATRPRAERIVGDGPLNGSSIPVEVSTHVAGMLEFVSGAVITILMSFDIPKHKHTPIEIYGTAGSLLSGARYSSRGLAASGKRSLIAMATPRVSSVPSASPTWSRRFSPIAPIGRAARWRCMRLKRWRRSRFRPTRGRRMTLETTVERPAMLSAGLPTGQHRLMRGAT